MNAPKTSVLTRSACRSHSVRVLGSAPNLKIVNGADNGNPSSHASALNTERMAVADLTPPALKAPSSQPRTLVVPPRPTAAFQQTQSGQQNGSSIAEPARRIVNGLLAPTASFLQLTRRQHDAALVQAEQRLQQQSIELRQTKMELAQRDAEIAELRAQAAEQDARFRALRTDLLEARAAAVEKDELVRNAGIELANAGEERARLRHELISAQAELMHTRAELESLADEILSMRADVLNAEELAEIDVALAEASAADAQEGDTSKSNGASAGGPMAPLSYEDGVYENEMSDGGWEAMAQSLAQLSRDVLNDAEKDEKAFSMAGFLKGLDRALGLEKNWGQKGE